MTKTPTTTAPRVWPDLAELEARHAETEALIERAKASGKSAIRIVNLTTRLESYEYDIHTMKAHALVLVTAGMIPTGDNAEVVSGFVWRCACGVHGGRPTRIQAAKAHGRHVEKAVWG